MGICMRSQHRERLCPLAVPKAARHGACSALTVALHLDAASLSYSITVGAAVAVAGDASVHTGLATAIIKLSMMRAKVRPFGYCR